MHGFITGGNGFLGTNLVHLLLQHGWELTLLHRPQSEISHLTNKNIHFVSGSINDVTSLEKTIPKRIDAIFHMAANTSLWRKQNLQQNNDNIIGTKNLVKVSLKQQVKRFIFTSSISAYGFQKETITEQTPSTAESCWINYLRSKYLAEQEVKKAIPSGLDAVILNPCAIIGPYDRNNWSQLFHLIKENKLPGVPPGGGSFCHVKEISKAHLSAYERGRTGENYILSGLNASFLELIQTICQLMKKPIPQKTTPIVLLKLAGYVNYWHSLITGKEPKLTPEKVTMLSSRITANSSKAQRELGFNPNISLHTMLTDCYYWLLEQNKA